MTSTTKSGKLPQEIEAAQPNSNSSSPLAGSGPGGHKPSFKGTKLARRARSFKDDFLVKISQMRSPGSSTLVSRAQSPNKSSTSIKGSPVISNNNYSPTIKGPTQDLDAWWKQTQIALKHLKDVVSKNKLEMLSGNGTIILDTIWHINLSIKSSIDCEKSNSIVSATHRVFQTVARLIKLCDDALLDNQSTELRKENVNDIVTQVEDAVKKLIELAEEKITQQQIAYKTTPRVSHGNNSLEVQSQRNSLPDIPLTPREREILEQTSSVLPIRNSHSTESILRDPSPPPKPPLPIGNIRSHSETSSTCTIPPPLPPKKRNRFYHNIQDDSRSADSSSPVCSSLERVSLRSKSPEDSLSLLSEGTGSIDSMLNHSSKEEDEIKALMECDQEMIMENHISDISGIGSNSWEESTLSSEISNHNNAELQTTVNDYHRLSNTDSGILSIRSSYSKRSSQQSSMSTQYSTLHQSNDNILESPSTSIKMFTQKNSSSSSSSSFVMSNSTHSVVSKHNFGLLSDEVPPAIPQKTKKKTESRTTNSRSTTTMNSSSSSTTTTRQPSPYDNVSDFDNSLGDNVQAELLLTCQQHQSHQQTQNQLSTIFSSNYPSIDEIDTADTTTPPPIPPKKKHMLFHSVAYSVMAYMEMFGNCSHTNDQEFMQRSLHMAQSSSAQWSNPCGLTTTQSCSFSHMSSSSISQNSSSRNVQLHTVNLTPHSTIVERCCSPSHSPNTTLSSSSSTSSMIPPALPPKQKSRRSSSSTTTTQVATTKSPPPTPTSASFLYEPKSISSLTPSPNQVKSLPDLLEHTTSMGSSDEKSDNTETTIADVDLMEEISVDNYLIKKKNDEEGPELRGGSTDALIIQATKTSKNGEENENVFAYQEAFLTTYRTFISPYELILKLIRRYNHFYYQQDNKPRSREAFALIVRVVNDLTGLDLDESLIQKLVSFVQHLISCGEIILAKALRVKFLERHAAKQVASGVPNIISTITLNPKNSTLLDFKSEQIAEQMTLLDAELFMKIEIPEVLIWAQEQNEERSPNLTRFTEHFNKMSYWARTKILTAETKEIREKYFMKFIKIMKHLRKINNFNSYLALLSALDSAPVRRLEWQKHVQEGLKEYCALIDSSSSFRAYRTALAETQPPCIPYIGLVLQDLTFVHIGNTNLLPDGMINFSKRWQQFNILENMKKFKSETYSFKKNEKIIQFFENFNDYIGEDAMWKLSEKIKPRGGKKAF